jgi:uncharacterized BrkB/YihY/UPF0761 family membrane protein
VLFAACFRLLTAAQVTRRQVLPRALLAAGCWLALSTTLGGPLARSRRSGIEPSILVVR